jgi:formamidopyrimidine-DNA glycosylase
VPEIIEVEMYRRAALVSVGRTITEVHAPDAWFCKGAGPAQVRAALLGSAVAAARRRGKLLVLDLVAGPRLGIRFGMTGRLVVDGRSPIDALEYGTRRQDPVWDRFSLAFNGGGTLVISDPRRLGGVQLDPDEDALGPDAYSLSREALDALLEGSVAPVKARMLDQSRLAGVGNLLVDETLWRAAIDPARLARSLLPSERAALLESLHLVLSELTERGGSHTGDLQEQRRVNGVCPADGTHLLRRQVGGRTTYSCPMHQH